MGKITSKDKSKIRKLSKQMDRAVDSLVSDHEYITRLTSITDDQLGTTIDFMDDLAGILDEKNKEIWEGK